MAVRTHEGAIINGNAAADMFQESLEDFLRRLIDRCAHRVPIVRGEDGRQGEKWGGGSEGDASEARV